MGTTAVAGASAPAMKQHAPTKVGGAKGTKGAGAAAKHHGHKHGAGHASQAGAGVKHLGGKHTGTRGGGASDMSAVLDALRGVAEALAMLVESLRSQVQGGGATDCGQVAQGGEVAGAQGQSAATGDYVAPPAAPHASAEDDDFEGRVLELINAERAKYGLAPVRYSNTLDTAAEKHAVHMARVGKMAHDGIGDADPGARIRAEGFGDSWGENVATGQTSPEQVVAEWMASPGHRRNILDPTFRQMGVAYTTSSGGRSYWAQEFGA